jgi:hypothetical protein
MLPGSSHIGLAIGGQAQRELWPRACDWLAERTDRPAVAGFGVVLAGWMVDDRILLLPSRY